MFKLLCQLFIAITGQSLPEEVFEDTFYHLLQGKRKSRCLIERSVKDFSSHTSHQLLISGWPIHYITARTKKGNYKIENIISNKKFVRTFHTQYDWDLEDYIGISGEHKPIFRSVYRWTDKKDGDPNISVIFHFKNENDKKISKLRINRDGICQNSGYKLEAHDISHLSKCYVCDEFIPIVSNLVNTCGEEPYTIEVNRGYLRNSRLLTRRSKACHIPICNLCENSKQRQQEYRYKMFNPFQPDLDENSRIEYHTTLSWVNQKPDISHIPSDIKLQWDTPLDYAGYYNSLIQPLKHSYWHPELSADEYMRYMEYERQKIMAISDPLDDDNYPEV